MKFHNLLRKKLSELEFLSTSLVYKEEELLHKYQDKLEESDLENNQPRYEKKGLLDAGSSSEEEEDGEFEIFFDGGGQPVFGKEYKELKQQKGEDESKEEETKEGRMQ